MCEYIIDTFLIGNKMSNLKLISLNTSNNWKTKFRVVLVLYELHTQLANLCGKHIQNNIV